MGRDTVEQLRARQSLLHVEKDLEKKQKQVYDDTPKEKKQKTEAIFEKMLTNRESAHQNLGAQLNRWLPKLSETQQNVLDTKRRLLARSGIFEGLHTMENWLSGECGQWNNDLQKQSKLRLNAVKSLSQILIDLRGEAIKAGSSFLQLEVKPDTTKLHHQLQSLVSQYKIVKSDSGNVAWCAQELAQNKKGQQSALDKVKRLTTQVSSNEHMEQELKARRKDLEDVHKKLNEIFTQFVDIKREAAIFLQKVRSSANVEVKIALQAQALLATNNKPGSETLGAAVKAFQLLLQPVKTTGLTKQVTQEDAQNALETVEASMEPLDNYLALSSDNLAERSTTFKDALRRAEGEVVAANEFVKRLEEECLAAQASTKVAGENEEALQDLLHDHVAEKVAKQEILPVGTFAVPEDIVKKLPADASPFEKAAAEMGVAMQ